MSTREIAGKEIHFDDEGFMTNPDEWSKEVAQTLAKEEDIPELTDQHWKVLEFIRDDYKERGQVPAIRRITKTADVPTKELYQLFPNGPAKKAARIAGLSKPKGCV